MPEAAPPSEAPRAAAAWPLPALPVHQCKQARPAPISKTKIKSFKMYRAVGGEIETVSIHQRYKQVLMSAKADDSLHQYEHAHISAVYRLVMASMKACKPSSHLALRALRARRGVRGRCQSAAGGPPVVCRLGGCRWHCPGPWLLGWPPRGAFRGAAPRCPPVSSRHTLWVQRVLGFVFTQRRKGVARMLCRETARHVARARCAAEAQGWVHEVEHSEARAGECGGSPCESATR